MSKFIKAAVAAAMVMGAFASTSSIAAGNNGTARFYGTIEDSPCSIVPDDHKLEVDLGDIGSDKLKSGGSTTPKEFQIHLQDCVFDTETKTQTTFTGTIYTGIANSSNYTIFSTDTGMPFSNVSLAIGDEHGTAYKSGLPIEQLLTIDTSTSKGKSTQTLNFKAWLVGESAMPTLGAFEANTTFQITYL
ncbi:fimbrial protein [Escherichia albertii]|uniref:fimbrial protein n=1 Tax=Escherichia albertii TaxID=208962 RepID=UPI0010F96B70|nr:fimbrial protein [Escherichia albertii]EFF0780935.1 type 1 fimbrial protein [Escherichia albertii]MCZ8651345.1 fimbrial protein [Escherichia albertii]WDB32981.1 fimbrial protein [Escherichia albertii]